MAAAGAREHHAVVAFRRKVVMTDNIFLLFGHHAVVQEHINNSAKYIDTTSAV